jgi:hypothetical protein
MSDNGYVRIKDLKSEDREGVSGLFMKTDDFDGFVSVQYDGFDFSNPPKTIWVRLEEDANVRGDRYSLGAIMVVDPREELYVLRGD